MNKEEIKFLEERIKELTIFKKNGTKNIGFAMVGKCFSVEMTLNILQKVLTQNKNSSIYYGE
jgi:hypothetical protein